MILYILLEIYEIYTDNKSFVTLSKLNEIRRGAIELLEQKDYII